MANDSFALVARAARAIREGARRLPLAQRISERFALPQLYERYRKNFLTHGHEFLEGDDEIIFVGEHSPAPLAWRAIPSARAYSFSRATLTTTADGHVLLTGHYGGRQSELQMLPGLADKAGSALAVGAAACGMASTGHWKLDLSQHHWLELTLRSDSRLYELVVQYDGAFEGRHHLFRCLLPRGPEPRKGTMPGGAYKVLGVESDAGADEIHRAYKGLAMELHPDRGGDEEKFKVVSRAFALLSDPERRAKYDEMGPEEEEEGLSALADWRTFKVPFTAFKDPSFYQFSEKVATLYLILADEKPGAFALELGELKAGRCRQAELNSANFAGAPACENGFCECGFYNGMRVEPFNGPIKRMPDGSFPPGSIEHGYAEHHVDCDDF
ncbi:hypothetical protein AB1Y20_007341 [Prymnesium parvum]|uniref:J domain-containing protein n=1 Tax=Prymnesium parvum TaxID=97485 RepID=A0AB34IXA0_PRYPA